LFGGKPNRGQHGEITVARIGWEKKEISGNQVSKRGSIGEKVGTEVRRDMKKNKEGNRPTGFPTEIRQGERH